MYKLFLFIGVIIENSVSTRQRMLYYKTSSLEVLQLESSNNTSTMNMLKSRPVLEPLTVN